MRRLLSLALLALAPGLATAADVIEYYHLDGVGNVRVVTDQNKAVVERHDYYPFGEEWNPQGSSQPRRFTGKERDAETGLDYFGARYYGSKIGRFTSIDPVYTWRDNLVDPQRWNRYAYARNNPVKYVDPDGKVIDTILDVGSVLFDLLDIAIGAYAGSDVGRTEFTALGADLVGAAIPFATGGGAAIRAAAKAEHAGEALITANRARGVESEARVLQALGESKNTEKVLGREGASIPDYANKTTIGDIKDAKRVTDSPQLRIQRQAAAESGRTPVVVTGANTRVSKTVERLNKVERREDLGPR